MTADLSIATLIRAAEFSDRPDKQIHSYDIPISNSEKLLSELAREHHKELAQVRQAFNKIASNLRESKQRLHQAKDRLQTVLKLFVAKLDDLRRLSEETQSNERVLQLLDQVDELLKVPAIINEHISKKEYLEATKILVEKQSALEAQFAEVDCLREVKSELESKREEIYKLLMEELNPTEAGNSKDIIECMRLLNKTPDFGVSNVEPSQARKSCLFSFSQSSHAICFNEHFEQQSEAMKTLLQM